MRTILKLSFFLAFWAPLFVNADMFVDRSIVIFETGSQPRQDIKVSNSGDDVMYVKVEVVRVDNPGTESETRVVVSGPKESKLIATPNKLVVPAGGQKLVRLLNLDKEAAKEQVYRINITPIVAPLEEEVSQLRIIVAYQVLAIVQPTSPNTNLVVSRTGTSLQLKNTGNSNILLSSGKQCATESASLCEELPSRRLYAGNTWNLELPFDAPFSFSLRTFDGIKQAVFP